MDKYRPKVAVFNFAFQHYRLAILKQLASSPNVDLEFFGGVGTRRQVKALSQSEFPPLQELRSIEFAGFSWQRGIARRAMSREFDVVILGPALSSLTTWTIILGRKLLRRKTALWGASGRPADRSIRRYCYEVLNRCSSVIMTYGELEARAAAELGTPTNKIRIVRNATRDNQNFLAEAYGDAIVAQNERLLDEFTSQGRGAIGFIGRVVPEKRIDVLLDAVRRLRETHPHVKAVIVGDGPSVPDLKNRYGDVADFHGWVYESERLRDILSEVTFLSSPNGIGLLAVDGLRFGKYVLFPESRDNGSEVECLENGVTGWGFMASDAESLRLTAIRAADEARSQSPDQYLTSRETALKLWSPDAVAENILGILSELFLKYAQGHGRTSAND